MRPWLTRQSRPSDCSTGPPKCSCPRDRLASALCAPRPPAQSLAAWAMPPTSGPCPGCAAAAPQPSRNALSKNGPLHQAVASSTPAAADGSPCSKPSGHRRAPSARPSQQRLARSLR
eukprot:1204721-Lingulodinium_polyedra.AAC.1